MIQRLERLQSLLQERNLDALALNPGPSLTYLSGVHFHLMERPVLLLVARGAEPLVILPELERPKVGLFPYPVQAVSYGEDPSTWQEVFRRALGSLGLEHAKIGVEGNRLRLLEYRFLQAAAPQAQFVEAGEVIGALRRCKDAQEIACIRKAVEIAEKALEATLPSIRVGMSERELAAELTVQLLRHGSDPELPFAPIVASGPNSANPHATPGDRPLQPGDLLVIDWGATYQGYISDLTRTFAVGAVEAELQHIAQIVAEANSCGRQAARPGNACAEIDGAARRVIEAAGYGAAFPHRTGHGIGLEAHEEPYLRGDNLRPLEIGMTFTVEPGIYLESRGGVRIEDNLVITAEGAETLSTLPRNLRVVAE
ncbi:MAG: Xaa-Pro peptidase family protein [Anaerolineales bacterium]